MTGSAMVVDGGLTAQ